MDVRFSPIKYIITKEKVVNGKKIYNQAPYFYISKKPAKFGVNHLSDFRVIVVTDLKNVVSRKRHSKFYLQLKCEWNFCLSTYITQSILLGSTSNLESIFPRCYTIRICKNRKIHFFKIPTATNPLILK